LVWGGYSSNKRLHSSWIWILRKRKLIFSLD
jgi:hypothetical protein